MNQAAIPPAAWIQGCIALCPVVKWDIQGQSQDFADGGACSKKTRRVFVFFGVFCHFLIPKHLWMCHAPFQLCACSLELLPEKIVVSEKNCLRASLLTNSRESHMYQVHAKSAATLLASNSER